MQGYDPKCPNCNQCGTCHGKGQIYTTRNVDPKKFDVRKELVDCPTCKGLGGKPGAGPHNHP